jgi:hypothetical protein
MLSVHSPRRGTRVLLTERHVRAVHNTGAGIVLEVETDDGERLFVVTGRALAGDDRSRLRAAREAVARAAGRAAGSRGELVAGR